MIVQLLWDSLWQGAIVAVITLLATRAVSDRNATTRYALWFAALIAMVGLPLATYFSHAGAALVQWLVHEGSNGGVVIISLKPLTTLPVQANVAGWKFGAWVEAAWIAGVAVQLARFFWSLTRVAIVRRCGVSLPHLPDDVLVSEGLPIPIAAGFIRPRVILPPSLVAWLSHEDLAAIVDHERAHIRRGDIWGNVMQRAIEAMLWFNPFVHLAGHYLVRERESACDDWAVRGRTATDYAACLAALATRPAPSKGLLTPSVLGSDSTLLSRVRRLMRGVPGQLSLNYYTLGGIVITFAILTLAVQALNPAPSSAAVASIPANPSMLVAASCATPNRDAQVLKPVPPDAPKNATPGFVDLLVKLDATGAPTSITIQKATKTLPHDQVISVIRAAQSSTYAPAMRNCVPIAGAYIFHAEFEPEH